MKMALKFVLIVLLFIQFSPETSSFSLDLYDVTNSPAQLLKPFKNVYCCSEEKREHPQIYCYKAANKTIDNIWFTAEVSINLKPDQYDLYWGSDEKEVADSFISQQSFLRFNFFFYKPKDIKLNAFNDTCFGILTDEDYTLVLRVYEVTLWRTYLFVCGLSLFLMARRLARDKMFYYITGVAGGVFLSVLLLLYYMVLILPVKKTTIALMSMGGGSMALYLMDWIVNFVSSYVSQYQPYVLGYIITSAVISFLVCYWYGPITNPRSLNIMKWTLQSIGILAIWASSDYKEAVNSVIGFLFVSYYFPYEYINWWSVIEIVVPIVCFPIDLVLNTVVFFVSLFFGWFVRPLVFGFLKIVVTIFRTIRGFSHHGNPNAPQLLTREEYEEQGREETEKAINDLRDAYYNKNLNPYSVIIRLSPEGRQRTLQYLAGVQEHVNHQEHFEHIEEFGDVEITDDEDTEDSQ